MAINSFYTPWVDNLMASLLSNNIKVLLVDASYTPDPGVHTSRSDIPVNAILGEATLSNKSVSEGRLYANDVTFAGVTLGAAPMSLVVVDDTAQKLIAVIQSVTGLSESSPGGDALLVWGDNCGIFSL